MDREWLVRVDITRRGCEAKAEKMEWDDLLEEGSEISDWEVRSVTLNE